jgi:2-haloacid dehalogenase
MTESKAILAFDVYGTLFDTASINSVLQSRANIGDEQVKEVSKLWRRYQLEYAPRILSRT